MPLIGSATSLPAVAAAPATPTFTGFSPSRITLYRDGGTIKLEGLLNRSVSGTVRLDGRINSPTRGQFFVTTKHFMGGAAAPRKMTRAELAGLQTALKRYVKNNPAPQAAYGLMLKRIADVLKAGPIAPNLKHSTLTNIQLRWSPGMGTRPPPGTPFRGPGLYLSADVQKGHTLHIDDVKLDAAKKTVTIEIDARGLGAPKASRKEQELFVRGGFSMRAENWHVIVMDSGKIVETQDMRLGGPPAP